MYISIILLTALLYSGCSATMHKSCICVNFIAEHTRAKEEATKVIYRQINRQTYRQIDRLIDGQKKSLMLKRGLEQERYIDSKIDRSTVQLDRKIQVIERWTMVQVGRSYTINICINTVIRDPIIRMLTRTNINRINFKICYSL